MSLKSNTALLQALLSQVEALPEYNKNTSTEINLQDKSATPTKSTQRFTADSGYDGIGEFTVNPIPDQYVVPTGDANITSNGTHDVSGKSQAVVNVPIPDGYVIPTGNVDITENGVHDVSGKLQATVNVPIPDGYVLPTGDKSITPTESAQNNVDVKNYATVSVGAIDSNYVGSAIARNPEPTVNGRTVTTPIGYYSESTSKSVAYGSTGDVMARKSAVSNNSVSVTPYTTDGTSGWIDNFAEEGRPVTVTASELVSGSQELTANGNYDVTNLQSVNVNLSFITLYKMTSVPSDSTGNDGDICVVKA